MTFLVDGALVMMKIQFLGR